MKRTIIHRIFCVRILIGSLILAVGTVVKAHGAALISHGPRIIVSTDVGGTDPDDLQSLVHLLVYADRYDLEGLISSPYGLGRKEHILKALDAYETDYPNLRTYSEKYPDPDALRSITKQGALDTPGPSGVGEPTEGSRWIMENARRDDPRPLHILVWGGIEDLAQALNDAPDILPKLRVYWIGGPNKKWSVDAYNYVEQNHPKLWMIEANATYRGWFTGGNQKGEWGNKAFVKMHIAGHGALGEFFVHAKDELKMGDTPSVARLLHGTPDDPSQPSWGGRFVRIWEGRKTIFDHGPTLPEHSEVFGVTEFTLPRPKGYSTQNTATMIFNGGVPVSNGVNEGDVLRFRFSPGDAKVWSYVLREGLPEYGMHAVGNDKDSPGSELIISAVDKEDPRPVWVTVWGGPNVLAQALWKIRATRSPEGLKEFVSKLRVYTISDQDDSGPWIRKDFPDLFYVASPGFHELGGYHHATWTGISGDKFHGRFAGGDFNIVSNPWLDEHIRSKGPLGKQYPHMDYLMEGDTPSFLFLIENGLGNSEHPDWGGWGGRYEFYTPPLRKWHLEAETRPFWSDAQDEVLGVDGNWHTGNQETIWRWRSAYQNDFEARMNWSVSKHYGDANHPPVAKLTHANELDVPCGRRAVHSRRPVGTLP